MKRQLLTLLLVPLLSTAALAANGYTGPGSTPQVTTVSAAQAAADDTPVALTGQIVKRIKGDKYEFKDATGSIQVEIDDDEWPANSVSETAKVRLTGEVEHELTGREIDVDRLELLQ
ncbi:NirD/YgiW/YdeI family stress tolerance protein [Pseudomonas sp. UL073]|uniref:NirD/YgiW/YdeI family stress tolerance protein n=1 Tax=Zestomonas insulae TaxID=2809017 RepID=A0ABS2IH94_9GAMM|nr:NirD/YgiW/YdeI family stress tolerance protein [Pseudomonas insulae]MBM7062441.1 NirD/YgiW/YdeI family stress tolerance protein [Pseudomonas insulae]